MQIGTIGAGDLAQAFAKRVMKAGYEVKLSNSRGPESLREIVRKLGPGATAATREDAVACELVLCRALGHCPRNPRKSSSVEEPNPSRWHQSFSRKGREFLAGKCWKLVNEPVCRGVGSRSSSGQSV